MTTAEEMIERAAWTSDEVGDLLHSLTKRTPGEWADEALAASRMKKSRREHIRPFIEKAITDAISWHARECERLERELERARSAALEEAAQEADRWASPEQRVHGQGGPAACIRALATAIKGE